MEMYFVDSSNIERIGFEDDVLTIWFKNDTVYRYFDVPEYEFRELLTAKSVGTYFRENILGSYDYEKVV